MGVVKSSRLWVRFRGIVVATALGASGCFAGAGYAGQAAIVVDAATGQVLSESNADAQNHPASLTKMMTLYLTFQQLQSGRLKLDQPLPVSAWAAARAPSKLGLAPGKTISVRDCILAMITKSANDAAAVTAEGIAGSKQEFVELMNAQAVLLGMTATHFANASGLPSPRDTTTARDLAKLAMALYRDFPLEAEYFATRQFTFHGKLVRGHNRLMERYPGMDGLKTGYTRAAGFNLASTAVRDGRRLFAVVMGGHTAVARDKLMARLLDASFAKRRAAETPLVQVEVAPSDAASRAPVVLLPDEGVAATSSVSSRHRHWSNRTVMARVECQSREGADCVHRQQTARQASRAVNGPAPHHDADSTSVAAPVLGD